MGWYVVVEGGSGERQRIWGLGGHKGKRRVKKKFYRFLSAAMRREKRDSKKGQNMKVGSRFWRGGSGGYPTILHDAPSSRMHQPSSPSRGRRSAERGRMQLPRHRPSSFFRFRLKSILKRSLFFSWSCFIFLSHDDAVSRRRPSHRTTTNPEPLEPGARLFPNQREWCVYALSRARHRSGARQK